MQVIAMLRTQKEVSDTQDYRTAVLSMDGDSARLVEKGEARPRMGGGAKMAQGWTGITRLHLLWRRSVPAGLQKTTERCGGIEE